MAEWICKSCIYYPPSSLGGKPCCFCNPDDILENSYVKREEENVQINLKDRF